MQLANQTKTTFFFVYIFCVQEIFKKYVQSANAIHDRLLLFDMSYYLD